MLIHWTLAAVHLIADHRGGHGHGAGGPMVERWEGRREYLAVMACDLV
jgi:hypothetical protein